MSVNSVSSTTKEKRQQQRRLYSKALFLETLKKDGGVYNSAKAAEILGRTKTTVKNWKDSRQLLALEIDGEFYYPVFQFTDDERISEKGVLRGVSEILPLWTGNPSGVQRVGPVLPVIAVIPVFSRKYWAAHRCVL